MHKFTVRLFKLSHISSYTRPDIDIFYAYRTISNIGIIEQPPSHTKVVEIDVTKAQTTTFININKVPIFNEFDALKPNNKQYIRDNYLYTVKAHSYIFE